MKTNGRVLIFAIAAMTAITSNAQIYRWIDAKGKPQYSDTPPEGVNYETVNRDELPVIHGQKPTYWRGYSSPTESENGTYLKVQRSTASLSDCKSAKRNAINAEKRRNHSVAERYDSWIWKHCKGYTDELRKLARDLD